MLSGRFTRHAIVAGILVAAWSTPTVASGPKLVLLEPEVEGDLSESAHVADWQRRLALIADHLRTGLGEAGLYAVVDTTPAHDLILSYRGRAEVHACGPCVVTLARRLHADRALSVWVFRMSHLVLGLHAILRDGETGSILYARTLSFRGDDDRAWLRAADYLLRDFRAIPAGGR